MTSVPAGHIILTPTQPVGSGRPQRGSNSELPHQESRALPTELLLSGQTSAFPVNWTNPKICFEEISVQSKARWFRSSRGAAINRLLLTRQSSALFLSPLILSLFWLRRERFRGYQFSGIPPHEWRRCMLFLAALYKSMLVL